MRNYTSREKMKKNNDTLRFGMCPRKSKVDDMDVVILKMILIQNYILIWIEDLLQNIFQNIVYSQERPIMFS